MDINRIKRFELERPDFIINKEILFNYIKSDNLFSYNQDGYELNITLYDQSFIKLTFELQLNRHEKFVFVSNVENKKDKDSINYQSYRNPNLISIRTEKKGTEYHLFKNPIIDNVEYIKLGSEYGILENLRKKISKVATVLKLLDKEPRSQEIYFFLNNINKNNIDNYINLIEKNKNNINSVLVYANEIHKLGFDVFNLSKEDIDIIELKTDIKCTTTIPEKNKMEKSFFLKIKNIFN